MRVFKTAFLILLLAFPSCALAEDVANAPEQHDNEEAASDEPPMDDEPEDGETEPPPEGEEEEGEEPGAPKERPTNEQLSNLHAKMDVDRNGKLSVDEVLQFVHETRKSAAVKSGDELFETADTDKDGKVSLDELMNDMYGEYEAELDDEGDKEKLKEHKVQDGNKFKAADRDNDGKLDAVEQAAFFNPEFDDNVLRATTQIDLEEKDGDGDGFLSFEEFAETRHLETNKFEEKSNETDSNNTEKEQMEEFQKVDKDGNGKIDVDELMAWQSEHRGNTELMDKFMKLADTDGDHQMTAEELHAAHDKDGEEHMHGRSLFMELVEHHEPMPEKTEL